MAGIFNLRISWRSGAVCSRAASDENFILLLEPTNDEIAFIYRVQMRDGGYAAAACAAPRGARP